MKLKLIAAAGVLAAALAVPLAGSRLGASAPAASAPAASAGRAAEVSTARHIPVQARRTGPAPFFCNAGCGRRLGECGGNYSGAECLFVHHATGRWQCPHCHKEYYRIAHTHP